MYNKKLLTSFSGKSFFLLILVSSFFFHSCGQMHGLRTTHAFFQQTFTGTIAVDENGNPITRGTDTLRFVYVTADILPFIDTVVFFGKAYQAIIEDKGNGPEDLGIKKNTTEKVFVETRGSSRLWRIDLSPLNTTISEDTDLVWIYGVYKGKNYRVQIKNVVELEPELRQ